MPSLPLRFPVRPPQIRRAALLISLSFLFMDWGHQVPAGRLHPMPERGTAVHLEAGSTKKVCQVVGEFDRHAETPTVNRTETRYKFWGTDLGASFEHKGKLFILFGDTHPSGGLMRPPDSDAIATSEDRTAENCVRLSFLSEDDGGFRPLHIPGTYSGAFAVPTGGLSIGGKMYVLKTSDYPGRGPMGRSVMGRSDDDGRTLRYLYDLSVGNLIHVSPALVPAGSVPGLPEHAGDGVLFWGSGIHRRSRPHLAFMPANEIENRHALRHFAGLDPQTGEPRWTADEAASQPLFDQPCVGEFSAGWNPHLRKWMLLYTCGVGRSTIQIRTADRPWGPWSEPEVLFDPARSGDDCSFLNPVPQPAVVLAAGRPCPVVSDAHTPHNLGDAYGPYLISRFTRAEPGGASTIYFLMSTWNPYTVVLMQATLRPRESHRLDQRASWRPKSGG